MLVRGGVDVNYVAWDGYTALHLAAMNGHLGVCEVLVASGANVGAVNKGNKTASALARKGGHEGVAEYLRGLSG